MEAGTLAEVVTLGEALIDFVSLEVGDLIDAPGFKKAPGGAPANVACGVAKLGRSSAFIGKVGDEPFGHFLERTFREAGVDTSSMVFDPKIKTGLAFVSLMEGGERDFLFYRDPSADMMLRPEELDCDLLRRARIFHYGSITLISEPSRSATLAAIELAREAGALISYDPNLRLSLWPSADRARQGMMDAVHFADFIKVCEEELEFMTGEPEIASGAAKLLEQGPSLVAVSRGAQGCAVCDGGEPIELPGFAVETIDTTGAGDGFVAAALVSLLDLWPSRPLRKIEREELVEAFTFANAVGALTTTVRGAIPGLPSAEAARRLVAQARTWYHQRERP